MLVAMAVALVKAGYAFPPSMHMLNNTCSRKEELGGLWAVLNVLCHSKPMEPLNPNKSYCNIQLQKSRETTSEL
jgi:hypothetical protein